MAYAIEWPLYINVLLMCEDESFVCPPNMRGVRCLDVIGMDGKNSVHVNQHNGAARVS